MASLVEQIKLLANPEPKSFDPEEDDYSSTKAQLVTGHTDSDDNGDSTALSALRRGNAPLLEDEDPKYVGRRTSRAELARLRGDFQDVELSDGNDSIEGVLSEDDSIKESNGTRHNQKPQELTDDENDVDGNDDVSIDDPNVDDDRNASHDDGSNDDEVDDDDDSEEDMSDDDRSVKDIQKFSSSNMEDEIEKGNAVKSQLSLWDSFLEYRIKVQKALVLANKLPQHMDIQQFTACGDKHLSEAQQQSRKSISNILQKLLLLQEKLLEQNQETSNILLLPGNSQQSVGEDGDEEIPSDSEDEENGADTEKIPNSSTEKEGLKLSSKRKAELTAQEFGECISKRHKAFQGFQDSTISKWSEKTRLASGKVNNKGFSSFDRSALTQIRQILNDKDRLIKRTQLKRSSYRALGKATETLCETENQLESTADAHLKDYDPQVFDDDDFYHQLLRELIERKTSSSTDDPIEMGRQWLELQKLRRKIKKKVDTKASKGRKIRYNVHSKLVSYMAPIERGTMSDSSRNELFSSLFGQKPSHPENEVESIK
ncbi:protein AATF isoform X2 [Nematostella vectensis]|uniref:protein AATF isoform X2 n=1 Tax=Nematostella vectensis TaxID=45351 RepID=UPI00138FAD99|nr:protein AATF isoform X2 [Nematostella vectensis]